MLNIKTLIHYSQESKMQASCYSDEMLFNHVFQHLQLCTQPKQSVMLN